MQETKEMIVTLTEKAAAKVKALLEKENKKEYGFRVGIAMGGCSGYTYEMSFEKEHRKNDVVIEDKGVKLFINPESVAFLRGSTVDYSSGLSNSGFKVNNPNVKRTCGCGHSVG